MTPDKKWIAQIEFTCQVSPDDFERCKKTLFITRETTVEQIVSWAESTKERIYKIELLPMQTLNPK